MGASDISIVTAFFDLGRERWTKTEGVSEGYQRGRDVYLDRFAILASLENEMVIYTSEDLVAEVLQRRKGKESKTKVIPLPFFEMFQDKREAIRRVQQSPAFIERINPAQRRNPERLFPDYILLTNLKPFFVLHAIQNSLTSGDQVAWVDFGYCRTVEALAGASSWAYAFDPDKIHLFSFTKYAGEVSIGDIVTNNIAYIVGGCVVAQATLWPVLTALTNKAEQDLLAHQLVDNDQTLFLLASLYQPALFAIHLVSNEGWWDPFRFFNQNAQSP